MEDKRYKITLSDGTVLDNLRLNGNNFISNDTITKNMFLGKLNHVEITDNKNNTKIHENMELVQVTQYANEYWFILRDISSEELEKIKQRADLEYIAMMTGVEL